MTTENIRIRVSDIDVQVSLKEVKNLQIGTYPPDGDVRVVAPLGMSQDSIRLAIVKKLGWIRKHQDNFRKQAREPLKTMVRGESHFFLGTRYRLEVLEHDSPPRVFLKNKAKLIVQIRPGATTSKKIEVLDDWYRDHLKAVLPEIVSKWEKTMNVSVSEWRVKKMSVKWGSCNIEAKRIWINLELAKKPISCLEYVVVHEMTHLLERHHTDRFVGLMDKFLPNWRLVKEELNSLPLPNCIRKGA